MRIHARFQGRSIYRVHLSKGFSAYLLFSFVFKTTATPSYTAEPPTQATRHRILGCYYTTPNTFWTVSPLLGIAASIPGLARSGAPIHHRHKIQQTRKRMMMEEFFSLTIHHCTRQWKFPKSTTLREDLTLSWSQWMSARWSVLVAVCGHHLMRTTPQLQLFEKWEDGMVQVLPYVCVRVDCWAVLDCWLLSIWILPKDLGE